MKKSYSVKKRKEKKKKIYMSFTKEEDIYVSQFKLLFPYISQLIIQIYPILNVYNESTQSSNSLIFSFCKFIYFS